MGALLQWLARPVLGIEITLARLERKYPLFSDLNPGATLLSRRVTQ